MKVISNISNKIASQVNDDSDGTMRQHPIDALFVMIESRRKSDPATSWTATLFSKGTNKIAQKVGEEAMETLIEAVSGNKSGVITESADLLYHLSVLWAATGVTPNEVYAELARRDGVSGIAEKASRKKL